MTKHIGRNSTNDGGQTKVEDNRKDTMVKYSLIYGIAILLVGLTVQSKAQQTKSPATTLAAERKAARAEGLPLTAADMARRPPVPDDKNAIIPYREIMAELEALPDWEDRLKQSRKILTSQFSKEDAAVAFRLHHDTIPFLKRIDAASQLPDCEIFRDYSQGNETTDTDYIRLEKLTTLLVLHAVHQENGQKHTAAMQLLAIVGRICSHLRSDRTTLALLYIADIEGLAQFYWTLILQDNQDDPKVVANARLTDLAFGDLPNFSLNWSDGIFVDSWAAKRVRGGHEMFVIKALPGEPRIKQENADEAELHALVYWRKIHAHLRMFEQSPFESYQAIKTLGTQQAENFKKNPAYALAARDSRRYETALPDMLEIMALRRVRRVMLGMLSLKSKGKSYPDDLETLFGLPVHDPFTNKPFHYQRTEKGIRLYSVGRNFQDDKGDAKSDDIGFTLR